MPSDKQASDPADPQLRHDPGELRRLIALSFRAGELSRFASKMGVFTDQEGSVEDGARTVVRAMEHRDELAKLVEEAYNRQEGDHDLHAAVRSALEGVRGAWGLCVLHDDHPEEIVVARNHSPLLIGLAGPKYGLDSPGPETFVASDVSAMLQYTRTVVDLEDGGVQHYLLVGEDGSAVNEAVLPMVADTVEITGEVVREDDLFVLRADPSTYRRADG